MDEINKIQKKFLGLFDRDKYELDYNPTRDWHRVLLLGSVFVVSVAFFSYMFFLKIEGSIGGAGLKSEAKKGIEEDLFENVRVRFDMKAVNLRAIQEEETAVVDPSVPL